jgi:integration host factor subunit beta
LLSEIPLTKSELIEKLTEENNYLNKRDAELVVNLIFNNISDALVQGDRVEIRGFGSFSVRERDAREARNPKSGEIVQIPDRKTPFFKTGKELRERVDREG